jgi:hypothetical protein
MNTFQLGFVVALGALAFGCASDTADSEGDTTGGDTTSGDTTGGDAEPRVCSYQVACGEKEFCDYPDDSCGADGSKGVCVPYALECSPSGLFCNCEGEVTNCGTADVSHAGGCELAPLQMACGDKVCSIDHEICVELKADSPTAPVYGCHDTGAPPCAGDAACDCTSFTQVCPSMAVGAEMESCEAENAESGGSGITQAYTVTCAL